MNKSWFDNMIDSNDPQVRAEVALLDLTEAICEKWGQYRGIYLLLYWLLEWTATILIWRGKP